MPPDIDPALLEQLPLELKQQLIEFLLGGGGQRDTAPIADPNLVMNQFGMIPDFTTNSKGEVEPYDLDTQRGQINQLTNISELVTDPSFLAAFGGAFAGPRPQDFEPIVNEEVIARPGRQKLMTYAQNPDTLEGFIAREMLQHGQTKTAIYQAISDAVQNPEASPEAAYVAGLVPINYKEGPDVLGADKSSVAVPDLNRVWSVAESMENDFLSDPDPSSIGGEGQVYEGADGVLYRRTETPSPWQEEFDRQGLHNPFQEYTAADFTDPDILRRDAQREAMLSQIMSQKEDTADQLKRLMAQAESSMNAQATGSGVPRSIAAPGNPNPQFAPRSLEVKMNDASAPLQSVDEPSTSRASRIGSRDVSSDEMQRWGVRPGGLHTTNSAGGPGGMFRQLGAHEFSAEQEAMKKQLYGLERQRQETVMGKWNLDDLLAKQSAESKRRGMVMENRTPYTDQRQANMLLIRTLLGR